MPNFRDKSQAKKAVEGLLGSMFRNPRPGGGGGVTAKTPASGKGNPTSYQPYIHI